MRRLVVRLVVTSLRPAGAAGAEEVAQTFAQDVAPILHEHCVACYRAGEFAPRSLMTHGDVRR